MARNIWNSTAFRTKHDMLAAIAEEWITAGGNADAQDEINACENQTAAELAAECADAWGLSAARDMDGEGESHMDAECYDLDDLTAAFADMMPVIKARAAAYLADNAE
jgi:hypothetical protein